MSMMMTKEQNSRHTRQVRLLLVLIIVFGAALSAVLWMIIGKIFPLYVVAVPLIAAVLAAGAIYVGQRRARAAGRTENLDGVDPDNRLHAHRNSRSEHTDE